VTPGGRDAGRPPSRWAGRPRRRSRAPAGIDPQAARRLRTYAACVSKVESAELRLDVVELAALCGVHGFDLADFLRDAGLCQT
jgi:hypothetical protein